MLNPMRLYLKRLWDLFVIGSAALSLAGCGSSGSNLASTQTESKIVIVSHSRDSSVPIAVFIPDPQMEIPDGGGAGTLVLINGCIYLIEPGSVVTKVAVFSTSRTIWNGESVVYNGDIVRFDKLYDRFRILPNAYGGSQMPDNAAVPTQCDLANGFVVIT